MNGDDIINNKIKEIREQKGMRQKELAIKANISCGYLAHLEHGSRNNPSIETMIKISKALDKQVQEVFIFE